MHAGRDVHRTVDISSRMHDKAHTELHAVRMACMDLAPVPRGRVKVKHTRNRPGHSFDYVDDSRGLLVVEPVQPSLGRPCVEAVVTLHVDLFVTRENCAEYSRLDVQLAEKVVDGVEGCSEKVRAPF